MVLHRSYYCNRCVSVDLQTKARRGIQARARQRLRDCHRLTAIPGFQEEFPRASRGRLVV